jgi:Protein of unknown function (DUF1579)
MPRDETAEQSTAAVPAPDPELQRLAPLLGIWTSEDHTNDSMLGPGVPVTSVETFDWLEGGYFLVHTYETVFGDAPAQKGVNYCGYDAEAKKFGSSSSATTARSPSKATATKGRSPTGGSPSRAPHGSSTRSTTRDGSR